jgi:hypothetical protein
LHNRGGDIGSDWVLDWEELEMNEEILKRLDALAAKLGIASAHLWDVMITQSRIDGVEDLVFAVMYLLGTAATVWVARWLRKQDDDFLCEFCFFVTCIVVPIWLIVSTNYFYHVPGELFNPEYSAFSKLAGSLK